MYFKYSNDDNKKYDEILISLCDVHAKAEEKNKEIIKRVSKESVFTTIALSIENILRFIHEAHYGNYELFQEYDKVTRKLADVARIKYEEKKSIRDFIKQIETGEQDEEI